MVRKLALLVAAVLTLGLLAPVAAAAATGSYGVSVSLPKAKTVYNHAKAPLTPSVHVKSGVHKAITKRTVLAYQGRRRVATGTKVWLRIGTYKVQSRITYRAYHYVTRHRTVKVYHAGGMPDGTKCVITAAEDRFGTGELDYIDSARCTNSAYPGQTVTVDDSDLWDVYSPPYAVGETVTSDVVSFASYYTYSSQAYQAKVWDAYHSFTTGKHTFTVKDGGHQRIYAYRESHRTPFFTVPSHWRASYAFDCSSFGYSGNWIVELHRKGSSVLYDKTLRNQIKYRGSGGWKFSGAGTFQFKVITECDWAIVVRWR